MNLKQLEYFITSAEEKNITLASKKLNMSQPPLSKQIQLLEEELGVRLITRGNKGIELTDAGKIFYGRAKQLFCYINEMCEELSTIESGLRGKIKIGMCYSTFPIIMKKVSIFLQKYGMVEFSFVHGHINEMYEELHKGDVDLLFLRNCVRDCDDFSYKFLEEDTIQLVIHKDIDPQPDCDDLEIDYIRDLPLCVLNDVKYPGHNSALISECKSHGFLPHIVCDCYDTSLAMALALSRIAATFLPESIISSHSHPDLRIKRIRKLESKSQPVLIWNTNGYHSQCTKNFLAMFT